METQTSIRHAINSMTNYEKCLTRLLQKDSQVLQQTYKILVEPVHYRPKENCQTTKIMFGERTDSNIKGKLTQKREIYTTT